MHGERKAKVLGADVCWAGLDGWGVQVPHLSSGLVHPKYLRYYSAVSAEVMIPILSSPRAWHATFRQLQLTRVRGARTLAHFLPNTMSCCTRKCDIISLHDITQSRQLYTAQKHHQCCKRPGRDPATGQVCGRTGDSVQLHQAEYRRGSSDDISHNLPLEKNKKK